MQKALNLTFNYSRTEDESTNEVGKKLNKCIHTSFDGK